MSFDAVDVIVAKRDGHRLSDAQIDWVVDAYTRGEVADEQMSALTMAILLNGMDRAEIARWTAAMIASGERLDFSGLSRPTADKHSTGGVGDKITLPLAPLVAVVRRRRAAAVRARARAHRRHAGQARVDPGLACGAEQRGDDGPARRRRRGHLPGRAQGSPRPTASSTRCATSPARSSRSRMIAASIMSKKIAEGTGALVLDVKVGSGAFMKDVDRARELARTMVELGTDAGVKTVALLTDMSTPLGLTAGNALEVRESVEVLAGGGPADVVELTVALAREMLAAAGRHGRGPRRRARATVGPWTPGSG